MNFEIFEVSLGSDTSLAAQRPGASWRGTLHYWIGPVLLDFSRCHGSSCDAVRRLLGLDMVKDSAGHVAGGAELGHLLPVGLGLDLSDFGLLSLPCLELASLAEDPLAEVFLLFAHFLVWFLFYCF